MATCPSPGYHARVFPRIAWPLLLTAISVARPSEAARPKPSLRRPAPDAVAQTAAVKSVQSRHGEHYAATKTSLRKQALARELIKEVNQQRQTPTEQYALLRAAADMAAAAGDPPTVWAAIDEMAERFELDDVDLRSSLLAKTATAVTFPVQRYSLVNLAVDCAGRALLRRNDEAFERAMALMLAAAERSSDPQLVEHARACHAELGRMAAAGTHEPLRGALAGDLVRRHVAARQWLQAAQYAEIAAAASDPDGLTAAAGYYEAVQEWDRAEDCLKRRTSETLLLETHGELYFFCNRTGHGNAAAALSGLRRALQRVEDEVRRREAEDAEHVKPSPQAHAQFLRPSLVLNRHIPAWWQGMISLLEGRMADAAGACERAFAAGHDPFAGLLGAIAADRARQPTLRDNLLAQTQVAAYQWQPVDDSRSFEGMIVLAGLIARDLAEGGKGQIAAATVAALGWSEDPRRADLLAILGLYLEAHGTEAAAVECWKQAVACNPLSTRPGRTIAGARLVAHKVPPESYRDLVLQRSEAKQEEWDAQGVLPDTDATDELAIIRQYEARLFDPVVSAKEVDRLLAGLAAGGSAARLQAVGRLVRDGQGHQGRLVAFAAKSEDIGVRQACAEVVTTLDASYQTGAMAHGLKVLQAKHFEELLPKYWQRFRKDPHDLRAVAMLTMSDPEVAFGALSKVDRLDGLRFLLLRIREATSDLFAHRRLFQYTPAEVRAVLADVFPQAGSDRLVGHVLRKKATVTTREGEGGKLAYWTLTISDVVFLFRYESPLRHRAISYAAIELVGSVYSVQAIDARGKVRRTAVEMTEDIACPLPQLELTLGQEMAWRREGTPAAWWIEPYVPDRFRWAVVPDGLPQALEPAPRVVREDEDISEAGAAPIAPRTEATRTGPLGPDSPSLVVLAPTLPAEATQRARTIAELACDRLAQEADLGGIARVVDRTQLDHVLQERGLAAGAGRTMLSCDAMARLEIDLGGASPPRSRLLVIDLSTGNVLGETRLGWPIQEAEVPAMLGLCRKALGSVTKGERAKRLTVRLVGLEDTVVGARMRPLVERLHAAFSRALGASPGVVTVQHLEAGSATEESLLLAMGLSRLPGGRQFVPQADVTITLRATERDAVGKTFTETPIEVGVRLGRAVQQEGAWETTPGTVKEFDAAVRRAWDKVAGALPGITPGAAATAVDEMTLRRTQAEAELQAAMAVDPHLGQEERALKQLPHLEAARKIDPSLEPAAYQAIVTLGEVAHARRDTAAGIEFQHRLVKEGSDYLERFPGDWERRAMVLIAVSGAIGFTPLGSLKERDSLIQMTPELHDMLDAAKQALEKPISGDVRGYVPDAVAALLPIVYRGMKLSGTPRPQRREWLEDFLRQAEEQAGDADRLHAAGRKRYLSSRQLVRIAAAEVAAGDGQPVLARALLGQVQQQWSQTNCAVGFTLRERVRKTLAALEDPAALAEFDRRYPRTSPAGSAIHWPSLSAYEDRPDAQAPQIDIQYFTRESDGRPRLVPLAEGDGRVYVFVKAGKGGVGYVPLDAQGRPQGRPVPLESRPSLRTWSTLNLLEPPKCQGRLEVLCARYHQGSLYLGTRESGLLCYDPKAGRWETYGPEEGLPGWRVTTVFPIGNGLFFCSGDLDQYTLDVGSGEVTLLCRGDPVGRRTRSDAFGRVWRDGRRLLGLTADGLWEDLLGQEPKYTKLPPVAERRGAKDAASRLYVAQYAAETAGRWFVLWPDELTEYGAEGKELRNWRSAPKTDPARGASGSAVVPATPIPPDAVMVESGGVLLLFGERGDVAGYDANADAWYGPLAAGVGRPALATPHGVWCGGTFGDIRYLHTADFLETARKIGRVATTPQYRERWQQRFESAPPLVRVKFAIMLRQHDLAVRLLDKFLEHEPDHKEALALQGFLEE